MRTLILSGAKCAPGIWDEMRAGLMPIAPDFAAYPHEVLSSARSVADLADWANDAFDCGAYDIIAGHSMGGQVALELIRRHGVSPKKLLLIESSPVPSGAFYRNLMTPRHMEQLGARVRGMMEGEAPFYSEALLSSLRDDFDFCDAVRAHRGGIYAFFGDRNGTDQAERMRELLLPADVAAKMRISFIENACHMPMLENPASLTRAFLAAAGE